jgi:hypothetical protein
VAGRTRSTTVAKGQVTTTLPERVEQKFFVPPNRMILALALIRRTCRFDQDYPEEQINSLYFDTPDLDQHERSLAGEFAKAKIRIRWYGTEFDSHGLVSVKADSAPSDEGVPVWLELKERRGFASAKQRISVDVLPAALQSNALANGIVSTSVLMTTMAGFGFFAAKRLCPVIAISYWRCRFVEPRTGFHIAFDSDVRSSVVMPGIGRGERGLRLPGAVVEVKGPSAELPACLRELGELGSSWTRFSKYSSSLSAHVGDLASVSRLWPSGVVHVEESTGVPISDREVAACGSK